jgi:hypothetical protein
MLLPALFAYLRRRKANKAGAQVHLPWVKEVCLL